MEADCLHLFVFDFMNVIDITLRRMACNDHPKNWKDVSLYDRDELL